MNQPVPLLKRIRSRLGILRRSLARLRHPALWPSFKIPSHVTDPERLALYRLAAGKKAVVEIGSYLGASACCFGAALRSPGDGRVYCIDTWNNDAMTEGSRDTRALFEENTARFRDVVVPVRGFSTAVVDQIAAKTQVIDLLFIDGDHSYEGAKADWDAYKSFLRPGSVVVFHDWAWAEGVKRVIAEDAAPRMREVDSLPNLWWGTIGS
jgi:predicted O-methyltransferase YrrM